MPRAEWLYTFMGHRLSPAAYPLALERLASGTEKHEGWKSMKYSFMSFSCPELSLAEMLTVARKFGYDGVELRLDAGHKHGVEADATRSARREIRETVAGGRVPICCLATSCRFADPENVQGNIRDALRRIDLAGDIGVSRLRVFGGKFPDDMSREEAIGVVVRALDSLAERARERRVIVCMETHDAWCDPEHVAEVMRRVNHPSIGVNWDIMHPVRARHATITEAFETLRRWIRHVHFHDGIERDGKLELVPVGRGTIDHRTAVRLLKDAGYDGYLSGEWIGWEPWEIHLPRELATMKAYEE